MATANRRAGLDETILKRRQRVFELRKKGLSLRRIAEAMTQEGYDINYETARRDLKYEMTRIASEMVDDIKQVRALELERYDNLQEMLLGRIYALNEEGKQILNAEGNPVPDLAVVDRLLRVQKQRAELLGVNAPVVQEINLRDITNLPDEELKKIAGGLA